METYPQMGIPFNGDLKFEQYSSSTEERKYCMEADKGSQNMILKMFTCLKKKKIKIPLNQWEPKSSENTFIFQS